MVSGPDAMPEVKSMEEGNWNKDLVSQASHHWMKLMRGHWKSKAETAKLEADLEVVKEDKI